MSKLDLSHSKMDIMRQCQKKYYYKYVEKLKIKQKDTSASDFGLCVHHIIEHYNGTGKKELLNLYKEVVPSKYKLIDKYIDKMPLTMKNIHEYYNKYIKKLNFNNIEKEFNISVELTPDISINGKIDLLVKEIKNKIVDYKTKKTYKFYNPKEQFSMYALLLEKKYRIPVNTIECDNVYLSMDESDKYGNKIENVGYDNIVKPCKITKADVELLKQEIIVMDKTIKDNIQKGYWLSNPTQFNCKYCEYNEVCPDKFMEQE